MVLLGVLENLLVLDELFFENWGLGLGHLMDLLLFIKKLIKITF